MKIPARLGDATLETGPDGHKTVCVGVEMPAQVQRLILDGCDVLVAIPLGPTGLNGPSLFMKGRLAIKDPAGGVLRPQPAGTTQALPPEKP